MTALLSSVAKEIEEEYMMLRKIQTTSAAQLKDESQCSIFADVVHVVLLKQMKKVYQVNNDLILSVSRHRDMVLLHAFLKTFNVHFNRKLLFAFGKNYLKPRLFMRLN